jgi:hypothetical protein
VLVGAVVVDDQVQSHFSVACELEAHSELPYLQLVFLSGSSAATLKPALCSSVRYTPPCSAPLRASLNRASELDSREPRPEPPSKSTPLASFYNCSAVDL